MEFGEKVLARIKNHKQLATEEIGECMCTARSPAFWERKLGISIGELSFSLMLYCIFRLNMGLSFFSFLTHIHQRELIRSGGERASHIV